MKLFITFILICLSALCLGKDYVQKSPYQNSNYVVDGTGSGGFKTGKIFIKNNLIESTNGNISIKVNGIEYLKTDSPLKKDYFNNNTSLYGWQNFTSNYANGATIAGWDGGENLTVISNSNISVGIDHLGGTNALVLSGANSDAVYVNSSTFDTANESFTAWLIFKGTDSTASG